MNTTGRALIAVFVFTSLLFQGQPALAKISMTVQPLVAEFNILPGDTSHITVTVSNSGTTPQLITARRVDWRTISDGSIALEKVGAEGSHSITRDLSLSSYQFSLQPGERREVSLTLSVPAGVPKTPASYWGGFIFTASDLSGPRAAVGVAATVFIYENVDSPNRQLALQSMRIVSSKNSAALIARIRNTGKAYLRPLAHLTIAQGGRVFFNEPVTVNAVFPDSTRILNQQVGHLPPGEYRVELTIDYGGNSIIDGITNVKVQ